MFRQSMQLEICCDAPPYGIVRACAKCGFASPLDVRWCRLSHFVNGKVALSDSGSGLLGRRNQSGQAAPAANP